ncbi:MAG: hypothetical protein HWE26_08915 [Alteromonadaceae bacterium]|nr:hypothetical protein [Alteromonadaceae bacterium]
MKICLFTILMLFALCARAEWVNPSEQYTNEYKNHESAKCPVVKDNIKHFVYFARDREGIINHPLLQSEHFAGAQIMYPWAKLEPNEGEYDFAQIESDLKYLQAHNKTLFIQLQDATFTTAFKAVPNYLMNDRYANGVTQQFSDSGEAEGWVAKRWNKQVRAKFAELLYALGEQFDGRVAGINLQESAIGVSAKTSADFSEEGYVEALKANMSALKRGFKRSATIQYANFMPGEWLPWENKGYLKSIYEHGEQIGVGMGAPDLMPRRKGQLNHALAMMHEGEFSVPLSIAVQDGNYIGKTNSMELQSQRKNLVPGLVSFAKHFLKVDYMFWTNQAPYFEQDVMTCFD